LTDQLIKSNNNYISLSTNILTKRYPYSPLCSNIFIQQTQESKFCTLIVLYDHFMILLILHNSFRQEKFLDQKKFSVVSFNKNKNDFLKKPFVINAFQSRRYFMKAFSCSLLYTVHVLCSPWLLCLLSMLIFLPYLKKLKQKLIFPSTSDIELKW